MTIGERYERILGAAEAVIARRGFHQASIREIARAAGLSLAGLYHYVESKDELLFLVLDRSLDRLLEGLGRALADASTREGRLQALIRTHLDFGFRHAHALRIVNRDHHLVTEPRRAEIVAKRRAYLERGLGVLRELDAHGRSDADLRSATNLLLGMCNGIATRPFLRSAADVRALTREVATLFLHGFVGTRADASTDEAAEALAGARRVAGPALRRPA